MATPTNSKTGKVARLNEPLGTLVFSFSYQRFLTFLLSGLCLLYITYDESFSSPTSRTMERSLRASSFSTPRNSNHLRYPEHEGHLLTDKPASEAIRQANWRKLKAKSPK